MIGILVRILIIFIPRAHCMRTFTINCWYQCGGAKKLHGWAGTTESDRKWIVNSGREIILVLKTFSSNFLQYYSFLISSFLDDSYNSDHNAYHHLIDLFFFLKIKKNQMEINKTLSRDKFSMVWLISNK